MHGSPYTPGEVVYLLSLTCAQARDESVRWADSCGSLSAEDLPATTSQEYDPVLLIARWHDVRAARERVVTTKEAAAVLEQRLAGGTEREVGQALGVSDSTVHRRFRATVEEILAELGAHAGPLETPAYSRTALCIACARAPRRGPSVCEPCAIEGERRREARREAKRDARQRVEADLRAKASR